MMGDQRQETLDSLPISETCFAAPSDSLRTLIAVYISSNTTWNLICQPTLSACHEECINWMWQQLDATDVPNGQAQVADTSSSPSHQFQQDRALTNNNRAGPPDPAVGADPSIPCIFGAPVLRTAGDAR